jgi:glycosylphosphatidylinositol transamidase
MLTTVFITFAVLSTLAPLFFSYTMTSYFAPTAQQYTLMKSFSLLLLGMFLSSLATLNFSLAFLVGLVSTPLTYVQPLPKRPIVAALLAIPLALLSPCVVLLAGTWYWELGVGEVLKEAAFGWDVWGMNTQVVIWCVWWPSWMQGMVSLFGRPETEMPEEAKK